MNKFIFHPVGQGLFYTGQLDYDCFYHGDSGYNFIFDCGSSIGDGFLCSTIDDYAASLNGRDIDLCVISHLHRDHYNGLKYLLRLQNIRIKKILLPYLPDNKMVRFAVLAGHFFDNNVAQDSRYEDLDFFKTLLGLYGIGENRNDVQSIILNREYAIQENFNDEYQYLRYNDRVFIENRTFNYWQIECYNKTLSDEKWQILSEQIIALLKEEGFESITKMLNYDFANLHKIAEIYGKVFKQQNPTSIVMKHYPIFGGIGIYPNYSCKLRHWHNYYEKCCLCNYAELFGKRNKNISVLTGDIEFDESLRKLVFDDYRGINVLQLPHHGAVDNWNLLNLPDFFSGKCVASFGLGNSYGHPSSEVVDGVKEKTDTEMIEVNQNRGYEYLIFD